jgi:ribosomal protein L37AE/L43A
MEKYGVEESRVEKNEKTANTEDPEFCPDCQLPLLSVAKVGVLKCPQCGTKPFEKR